MSDIVTPFDVLGATGDGAKESPIPANRTGLPDGWMDERDYPGHSPWADGARVLGDDNPAPHQLGRQPAGIMPATPVRHMPVTLLRARTLTLLTTDTGRTLLGLEPDVARQQAIAYMQLIRSDAAGGSLEIAGTAEVGEVGTIGPPIDDPFVLVFPGVAGVWGKAITANVTVTVLVFGSAPR